MFGNSCKIHSKGVFLVHRMKFHSIDRIKSNWPVKRKLNLPRRLRKCVSCGQYSLAKLCRICGNTTRIAHPPRFSIQDKYARFRRALRKQKQDTY
ncbi:MAG: H/ACA ribonucleoprotein complex subunit NOP10 [Candidatus Thorarchaeota archaeon]